MSTEAQTIRDDAADGCDLARHAPFEHSQGRLGFSERLWHGGRSHTLARSRAARAALASRAARSLGISLALALARVALALALAASLVALSGHLSDALTHALLLDSEELRRHH